MLPRQSNKCSYRNPSSPQYITGCVSSENPPDGSIGQCTSNERQGSHIPQLGSTKLRRRSVCPSLVDCSDLLFREWCYTMPSDWIVNQETRYVRRSATARYSSRCSLVALVLGKMSVLRGVDGRGEAHVTIATPLERTQARMTWAGVAPRRFAAASTGLSTGPPG